MALFFYCRNILVSCLRFACNSGVYVNSVIIAVSSGRTVMYVCTLNMHSGHCIICIGKVSRLAKWLLSSDNRTVKTIAHRQYRKARRSAFYAWALTIYGHILACAWLHVFHWHISSHRRGKARVAWKIIENMWYRNTVSIAFIILGQRSDSRNVCSDKWILLRAIGSLLRACDESLGVDISLECACSLAMHLS